MSFGLLRFIFERKIGKGADPVDIGVPERNCHNPLQRVFGLSIEQTALSPELCGKP